MPYEDESIYLLATMRQAELQAEVKHYRSGRQDAALSPTVSALLIAGAERVAHTWVRVRMLRPDGPCRFWMPSLMPSLPLRSLWRHQSRGRVDAQLG